MDINSLTLIENDDEWEWYKLKLDVDQKYHHEHLGKPEKYPCRVNSEWYDDPNGPYSYVHSFFYQKEIVCEKCGHKSLEW